MLDRGHYTVAKWVYATLHWNGVAQGTNDYAVLKHREAVAVKDRFVRRQLMGEVRTLYDKAWERGSTAAAYNIAMRYHRLRRNEVNYKAGKTWFKRAAAFGTPEAQSTIQLAHATHLSYFVAHPDHGKRVRLFRELAEGGVPEAQVLLADTLRGKDDKQALRYAAMAAGSGFFEGISLYAYLRWNRSQKDHEQAETIAWMKRAADMGDVSMQARLARGYQNGYYGLAEDHVKAIYWYERATSKNHRSEPSHSLHRASDGLRFPKPRLPWASELDTVEAAGLELARYYFEGEHVPSDLNRARALALRAVEAEVWEAEEFLSLIETTLENRRSLAATLQSD